MNKNLCIFSAFFSICSIGLSQTPFVKSNTAFVTKSHTLDTFSINFSGPMEKMNTSVDFLSKINESDIKTDRSQPRNIDSLSKEYNNKKYEVNLFNAAIKNLEKDIEAVSEKLKASKKAEDSEEIKGLKAQIEVLNNQLKKAMEISEEGNKKVKDLEQIIDNSKKDIEEISFRNQQLQSEIVNFRYSKYNDALTNITNSINELDKNVQGLDAGLKEMKWVENKLLDESDNKADRLLYIDMGSRKTEAIMAVAELKKPLEELRATLILFKQKIDRISSAMSFGINKGIENVLNAEFKSVDSLNKDVNTKIIALEKITKEKTTTLKQAEEVITGNQRKIVELYKKYTAKTDDDTKDVQAIAGITQPLGKQGQLVPTISILGFKSVSDENSSVSSQLKLFVGANAQDQKTFNSNYKLFIPEMSTFGFTADFSLGFIPSTKSYKVDEVLKQPIKKLGMNLGAYYFNKSLNRLIDSSEFSVGELQFKAGLQYIVIGKVLSIYANVNSFFITNGVDKFKESFSYGKKLVGFIDFGLDCYLDLVDKSKGGGLYIDFDLGFISAGGDVKGLVPGGDPLIPRIKISLVKGFKF
jgi:predicted  nucleic acid-binding Zn-ribbon protein